MVKWNQSRDDEAENSWPPDQYAEVVNATFTGIDVAQEEQKALVNHYGVEKLPLTVVVSPEGKVAARMNGLAKDEGLKKVFGKPAKVANVVFTSVDASKDYQKFILKHYQVEKGQAPVTLVVSPEDTVITRVPGLASGEKLGEVFSSPAKEKIAKELAKNKVVFLLFCNRETKHAKEIRKAAKEAQDVLKNFSWSLPPTMGPDGKSTPGAVERCSAGMVEVDPKDKKEAFLLKNLGIPAELEEATVMVAFGSGFVVRDKLAWEMSADYLIGIVQVLAGPCLCTMSPEMIVGNTLLLLQEKREKKKVPGWEPPGY